MKLVGIVADTGYGKSMSMVVPPDGQLKEDKYEGLIPIETIYYSLDKKELPFEIYCKKFPEWKKAFTIKGKNKELSWFDTNVVQGGWNTIIPHIKAAIKDERFKHFIIDTVSVGMHDIRMKREAEIGFQKWADMGILVYNLFDELRDNPRKDAFIWWLAHIDTEKNREGDIIYKAKVEGNLLDKFLEKWTTNVFFSSKDGNNYIFETQANNSTAKNPPLLFEETIPNSMNLVYNTLK